MVSEPSDGLPSDGLPSDGLWSARGALGIFLTVPAGPAAGQNYRDALDAVRQAESLGYTTAWVAEAHFNRQIGVPAALSLLAAAAPVTERIRLGTAVVPLAFDNPLRIAETAAFVNALSADRLELGVGKGNPRGFSTDAYRAFGLDEGNRDVIFARALSAVRSAFGGTVTAGDKLVTLHPSAGDLSRRIWAATGSHATAAAIGADGDGLLLYRTSPDGVAGEIQPPLIDTYLDGLSGSGRSPRIGISRALVPAASRRDAIAVAAAAIRRQPERPHGPVDTDDASVERWLIETDHVFGSPDDIVAALNADAAVIRSTDYLFSLPFAAIGSTDHRDALEVVANEIHPRLRRDPAAVATRARAAVGA